MSVSAENLIEAGLMRGLLEHETVARLRNEARRERVDLLETLAAHYRFPQAALFQALAETRGLPFVQPTLERVPLEKVKKLPVALLQRKLALPMLSTDGGEDLLLAMADPDDRPTQETLQRLLGIRLRPALADPAVLATLISRAYAVDAAEGAPVAESDSVAMLDDILREAYLWRASDIHLMPDESGLRVRLRVDGRLRDHLVNAGATDAAALVSRVKVLSNLDIAEQREAQDGGFSYRLPPPIDREFSIRVATAPTRLGERITMRLLGQEAHGLTLPRLGMSEEDLANFRQAIRKPFGMILLTGPTGSGKSTTLFAALQEINSPELNIMTVENPIEYVMPGVSQIQTGAKITFADALRSLLRHDPDVLMVGEIRDGETADVAIKAAMTGHLVFSTLHTNTACGTPIRLVDIGCEPYIIGSTMNAVIAQRLVRRLCPRCKTPRPATADECEILGVPPGQDAVLHEPHGCAVCRGTGFSGRVGLFETLWFDDELAHVVARGCTEEELASRAGKRLRPMWADGSVKVLAGLTTLDELREVAVRKG